MERTPEEIEMKLGEDVRRLRLRSNIDQLTLAARAGVSPGALKNLEGGKGTTVRTLIRVMRALRRAAWFDQAVATPSINPLTLPKSGGERQRARSKRLRPASDG